MRLVQKLLLALTLLMMGDQILANGREWFEPCPDVSARSTLFRQHWENNGMPVGQCFLLNSTELIYLDEYGLVFQSLKNGKEESRLFTDRNPVVEREFIATNKKRYALITAGRLQDGATYNSTYLLYLVSRGSSGRSFRIIQLIGSFDDDERCGSGERATNCSDSSYSVRLATGGSSYLDLTASIPFASIGGVRRLTTRQGAVSGIEFDVFLPKQKHRIFTIRYSLTGDSANFYTSDLLALKKVLDGRVPLKAVWIEHQDMATNGDLKHRK